VLSLIETAKLNGLDPEAYLRTVVARIANCPAKKTPILCPGATSSSQRTPDQTLTLRTARALITEIQYSGGDNIA
jgi:hypothetical protein